MPNTQEPNEVNPQITGAVCQTDVVVVGQAPAVGIGTLYQTIGNSVAMASANAVYSQQQANVTYLSASNVGVHKLLSLKV